MGGIFRKRKAFVRGSSLVAWGIGRFIARKSHCIKTHGHFNSWQENSWHMNSLRKSHCLKAHCENLIACGDISTKSEYQLSTLAHLFAPQLCDRARFSTS